MRCERNIYHKNLFSAVRALLILVALTMNMELLPYDAIDNDNPIIRLIVTVIMSMNGFDIVGLVAFPVLFIGMKKAFYEENEQKTWSISIPAVLFSLFMIIGYTFHREDSYYLLFGDWDLGQTAKTVIQYSGYYNLFYLVIYCLYQWLDKKAVWKMNENPCKFVKFLYGKHTWLKIFLIFFVLWMPYVIACFPGYVQGDTPDQLRQVFGMEDSTASYLNLLSEDVTLNNHHPVLHTLFLGGCFKIGHYLGNDNLGIFLYTMIQYILVCTVLASGISYLKKLKLPYWVRNVILAFYLFVPVYVNFAVLTTKDVIYAVFCMWYILFMAELLLERERFYKSKKKILCFFMICLLCVFMRHNGIYIVLFSLPFILLMGKKHLKFVGGTIVGILAIYLLVGHVVYPMFNITAGSRREALSIPLQQTGRYIYEYGDELTEEEIQVIEKVIDINECKWNYAPRLADPVKSTFNENVTSQELQEYFITWFKMFFKHPGCYVEAFLNNTYGYFYYGDEPAWKYTKTESENIQGLINPAGFDIHHIESLHSVRTLVAQYESLLTHFPVISIFSSCAFFTWITILLFMLLWKKKEMKKIFLLIPVIVSLLVCFAGPLNGINDFRYMFPIAFILPVVLGIELYIIYGKEEKTFDFS